MAAGFPLDMAAVHGLNEHEWDERMSQVFMSLEDRNKDALIDQGDDVVLQYSAGRAWQQQRLLEGVIGVKGPSAAAKAPRM